MSPPTSYLIFKSTHTQICIQRLFNSFRSGGERPSAARTGAGGPTLGLGAFPAGVVRVCGARRARANVSSGSGFLRSHLGFGDEVGRMSRQLVMF